MKKIVLSLFALFFFATCENGGNLIESLKIEVMKSNDRYLEISNIDVPLGQNGLFSPTGTISIAFDRAVDPTTLSASTIIIKDETGNAVNYPQKGISYVASSHTVKVRVYPFLDPNEDFAIIIEGVKGLDGSNLYEPIGKSFRTQTIMTGVITKIEGNTQSGLGYTKTNLVNVSIKVSDYYATFSYKIRLKKPEGEETQWTSDTNVYNSGPINYSSNGEFSLSAFDLASIGSSTEGPVTLEIFFLGQINNGGILTWQDGLTDEETIIYDATPPAVPAAPDLSSSSDSGSSTTDNITNVTNGLVFSGTAEALSEVTLYNGASEISTTFADDSGNWSTTVNLTAGTHSLTATAKDPAGNESTASSALPVTVKTSTTAPSAPDLLADDDSGATNTDNLTNVANPRFSGTAETGAKVQLYNGETPIGSEATAADEDWNLQLTGLTTGTYTLTARATDIAGNVAVSAGSLNLTLKTSTQTPSTPNLAEASDTGTYNDDNLTKETSPVIYGTAEIGNTIQLYNGENAIGASVTASPDWNVTLAGLTDGTYTLTARATDAVGNTAESDAFSFTIKTVIEIVTIPDLADVDDSGSSNSDNITKNTSGLTFSGTSDPGVFISLKSGTTTLATTTADNSGQWAVDISRSAGSHSIYAQATDLAGNTADSSTMTLTVKTSVTAPSVPDLAAADDSGTSTTDNITRYTTGLSFSGSKVADASVVLMTGTTTIATTTAPTSTSWTADITRSAGSHTIFARATDVAGNVSDSSALSLVVKTSTAAPTVPDLDSGTDSGVLNTDNITYAGAPWFIGYANTGDSVQLLRSGTAIGTPFPVVNGTWSIQLSGLTEGPNSISARATDVAGNTATSGSLTIIIDKTAPTAPTFITPVSPTTDRTPTWSWTSGGGGGGYRFTISYDISNPQELPSTTTTFTPPSNLVDNTYTLNIQERDTAGNLSTQRSQEITVDALPGTPVVTLLEPTKKITLDNFTTWVWESGGYGNGNFQYNINNGAWTPTTSKSIKKTKLADGSYTIYVQEQDAGGQWSTSGAKQVIITPSIPVNGQTKVSTIPVFQLRPVTDVKSYSITLINSSGVSVTKVTSRESYTWPNTLSFGAVYTWYITALKNDGTTVRMPSTGSYTFTTLTKLL